MGSNPIPSANSASKSGSLKWILVVAAFAIGVGIAAKLPALWDMSTAPLSLSPPPTLTPPPPVLPAAAAPVAEPVAPPPHGAVSVRLLDHWVEP